MTSNPCFAGPFNGFEFEIPFVRSLGFELHAFADGASRLYFAPRPEHLNSFGFVHGGAVMTLLDVTMASAARSVAPQLGVVTIEMKTSFMQSASGPLTSKGRLMHRSTKLAFTEGTVYDAKGRPCAHATGTFRYVERPDSHTASPPSPATV